MTDFAWLIEAPGQNYLAVRSSGHVYEFFWSKDHNKAVRFMSKEQADGVMMAVRVLAPALFTFAVNLGEAWPVKHGWFRGDQVEDPSEAAARIRELEALLKPFAVFAASIEWAPDEEFITEGYRCQLTIGNCRAALQALGGDNG